MSRLGREAPDETEPAAAHLLTPIRQPPLGRHVGHGVLRRKPLANLYQMEQVLAREGFEVRWRRIHQRVEPLEHRPPCLSQFKDLDATVAWRGAPYDVAPGLKPVDIVRHPTRIDAEALRELIRRTWRQLTDRGQELGHHPAEAHLSETMAGRFEVPLRHRYLQSPGTSRKFRSIVALVHVADRSTFTTIDSEQ